MNDRISAIILAAGLSSRMGRPKPLLPLGDGTTILERNISLFQDRGIVGVWVVIGHRREAVEPIAESCGASCVFNPDYRGDMFSSVVVGLTSLGPGVDGVFIQPVDIPLVRPSTIRRLLETHGRNSGGIIYPVHRGRRGHPPLIPGEWVKPIVAWRGPGGLRGALTSLDAEAVHVDVPDEGILLDVDTPEDYEALMERRESLDKG